MTGPLGSVTQRWAQWQSMSLSVDTMIELLWLHFHWMVSRSSLAYRTRQSTSGMQRQAQRSVSLSEDTVTGDVWCKVQDVSGCVAQGPRCMVTHGARSETCMVVTIVPTDFRSQSQKPEPETCPDSWPMPPVFQPSAHYASHRPCYSHAPGPHHTSPCTCSLLGTHTGPCLPTQTTLRIKDRPLYNRELA